METASSIPEGARRKRYAAYIAITVLVLAAKLVLVGQNEIVAEQFDAWAYVFAVSQGPISTLEVNAGYPLWLWLGQAAGIPQRIAIDALYVIAASVLAFAVARTAFGLPGYALILSLTAFSPATYFLFDHAFSDGFYMCLCLLAVGFSILTFTASRPVQRFLVQVILGLVLGMMAITRRELPLIVAALAVVGVVHAIYLRKSRSLQWTRAWSNSAFGVLISGAVSLLVVGCLLLAHWESRGVWALTYADLPSHARLLRNLAAIDTNSPARRFIPISREARQLAYRYSPTLDRIRSFLESDQNEYTLVTESVHGQRGEIGGGWIWLAFNQAALNSGFRTARELDSFYSQVNSELEAAFRDGKLKQRFVLHPLLGSEIGVWLPFVFEGAREIMARTIEPEAPASDFGFQAELFDDVCVRRAALIAAKFDEIRGWAFSAANQAVLVTAELGRRSKSGRFSDVRTFAASPVPRPDVQTAAAKDGRQIPASTGFVSRVLTRPDSTTRLRFTLPDGEEVTADALVSGKFTTARDVNGNVKVVYGIDKLPSTTESRADWRYKVLLAAVKVYQNVALWIVGAALAAIGFVLVARGRARRGDALATSMIAIAALIVGWLLCRWAFYTVINTAAWHAPSRYVAVSGVLAEVLVVIGLLLLWTGIPIESWGRMLSGLRDRVRQRGGSISPSDYR